MFENADRCYRIVLSRDSRFDGCFVTAVRTTGIYCRPSCPATTPKATNVSFFATAAAAQLSGYRACKRCRPDASPGSPEWNVRSDVVARAMRLIADGVVDRDGVAGLASRLGYSERHLNRLLLAEVGAGPLALGRSQRAQNARILVETTDMPMVDVAFAAGFSSLRQFNATVREVFDSSPTELRRRAASGAVGETRSCGAPAASAVAMTLRLAHRFPISTDDLFAFLGRRCLRGIELMSWSDSGVPTYHRTLDLPRGHGVVSLTPAPTHVAATVRLTDVRDLTAAVARSRRLLDLDADPVAVDERLVADSKLALLVRRRPGLRSPGAVDGFEMAVRAVLGQQVSVAGALTVTSALAEREGIPLTVDDEDLAHVFPRADAIAALDPTALAMPEQRSRALVAVAAAVAEGRLDLDGGADRDHTRATLLGIPGIGPWTADYVMMRALGDPDVLAVGDLVVRQQAERLGIAPSELAPRSREWTPWRSSVTHHLWAATSDLPEAGRPAPRRATRRLTTQSTRSSARRATRGADQ